MKKKIITLCLVIALLSVAVIGGTLAYFTDVDQATNEFTVGDVSIDLYEDVAHVDAVGNPKADPETNRGEDTDEYKYYKYDAVMPGDKMTKVVTVENDGTEAAYVALSVVQNNYGIGKLNPNDKWFNELIDNYYEEGGRTVADIQPFFPEAVEYEYTDAQMQDLTDRIFTGSGWGRLAYTKNTADGNTVEGVNPIGNVRYYPTKHVADKQDGQKSYVGESEIKLIAIDYSVYGKHSNNATNMMDPAIYNECAEGSRIWVFYLYIPAGKSIDFDFTVSVPTEIDQYSIQAFNNMVLDVRASAIQASGFLTAKDAFVALENVYSFGYDKVAAPVETTTAPEENG